MIRAYVSLVGHKGYFFHGLRYVKTVRGKERQRGELRAASRAIFRHDISAFAFGTFVRGILSNAERLEGALW